jgi:predicted nuclease of restriction endonuclease-like (RecB) superfamily
MNFNHLVFTIQDTHSSLQAVAAKAVNIPMTIRNWLIGFYIIEYEQHGEDRANYGDKLIKNLEQQLFKNGLNGLSFTNLNLYRQFYLRYPEMVQTVSEFFKSNQIIQTLSEQFEIRQTLSDESITSVDEVVRKLTSEDPVSRRYGLPPEKLLKSLSFSHFVELVKIEDDLKRAFYEIECAKGVWSVRELKRQVESLYFERSGISKDKAKLSALVQQQAVKLTPADIINTPFAVEFLGLNSMNMVTETNLEQALIDHLIHFLRELGQGFCFEDRQKRILIDDEYYFIDLVFYHRVLKCHVLIDLKTEKFKHSHAGQINAYLNYYRNEVMREDDNPPVGILLCTDKGNTMVKYATAGLDKNIFVQKYMLELPGEKELEEYLRTEMNKQ